MKLLQVSPARVSLESGVQVFPATQAVREDLMVFSVTDWPCCCAVVLLGGRLRPDGHDEVAVLSG